ncbi:hypothetical protein MTR67_029002 [Solanum verrucosum]|uniref:BURP domain-containing protein n=1 Tax=Solanum verrucosum TaxID=315347 RepID=A0AAF0TWB7_SOLVR|nr:hypothetical protein MTR67_029002 [Solanum verrucosum]
MATSYWFMFFLLSVLSLFASSTCNSIPYVGSNQLKFWKENVVNEMPQALVSKLSPMNMIDSKYYTSLVSKKAFSFDAQSCLLADIFCTSETNAETSKIPNLDSKILYATRTPDQAKVYASKLPNQAKVYPSKIPNQAKVYTTKIPNLDSKILYTTRTPDLASKVSQTSKIPNLDSKILYATRTPDLASKASQTSKIPNLDSKILYATRTPDLASKVSQTSKIPNLDSKILYATRTPDLASKVSQTSKIPNLDSKILYATRTPDLASKVSQTSKIPNLDSKILYATKTPNLASKVAQTSKIPNLDSKILYATRNPDQAKVYPTNLPEQTKVYTSKIYATSHSNSHHLGEVSFFRVSILKPGNTIHLDNLVNPFPHRSFLPSQIASKISINSNHLQHLFPQTFTSPFTKDTTKTTILNCNAPTLKGEVKTCAKSLEEMIEFSKTTLKQNHLISLTTDSIQGSGQKLKIEKFHKINSQKSVSCHEIFLPFATYFCHLLSSTNIYAVELVDLNTNVHVNTAMVVCHMDTSSWPADHPVFKKLNFSPGKGEVCHWMSQADLVWVGDDAHA